jgi:hypothetical protein
MNGGGASGYDSMRNLRWSPAEKVVARKAFDLALRRELEAVIDEARKRMAKVEQVSALWELEQYLTERRKAVDRRYDYRYSVLPIVFGNLISEGRLSERELHGLGEDKLKFIRDYVKS